MKPLLVEKNVKCSLHKVEEKHLFLECEHLIFFSKAHFLKIGYGQSNTAVQAAFFSLFVFIFLFGEFQKDLKLAVIGVNKKKLSSVM